MPTRWTDNTLPGNSSGVQYIITGMRGNVAGDPSQTLTVTFGVGSGGGMFIASPVTTPDGGGGGDQDGGLRQSSKAAKQQSSKSRQRQPRA